VCVAVATLALLLVAPASVATTSDRLEQHRLELEIERLQRDLSWQADLQRWLPAASALVAFAVAVYGVWRYFDERKQSRTERTEQAVGHNLERLIDRPADGTSPNARAIAALRNLDGLARIGSKADHEYRLRVTNAVTALVRDDLTVVDTADEARLPIICVDNWPDFERRCKQEPELARIVLERYLGAIGELARKSRPYVESARTENGRYIAINGKLSPEDALLFATVVNGFLRYVDLLPSGRARENSIEKFSMMAKTLGDQLFPAP
jgi:hypothetical protein